MKATQTIKKQVWFSPEEDAELKRKIRLTGLTEAALLRMLIRDYAPREKPDERFYTVMKELPVTGNNINQIAVKANSLGFIDAPMLQEEALKWAKFQSKIEAEFLRPIKKKDG